jgi:hypothetical protein
MTTANYKVDTERFARCIQASKRVRWDIDGDVIRGRRFDFSQKFLPDGLSLVHEVEFLTPEERRFLSQIQGRTYANIFGLVERFINVEILRLSEDHWLGDQVALEGLVRFCDEELKHQELFRRLEQLAGEQMPPGYTFSHDPNEVARVVLDKCSWAVLGLTCHIELFTQLHYKQSIGADTELSELFRDVFLFHWKEESQHAIMDELEWKRVDSAMTPQARDQGVNDLIDLVAAVDGMLQAQAIADADYFLKNCRKFSDQQQNAIRDCILRAYRWQYIVSGVTDPRFTEILTGLITEAQAQRVTRALEPLIQMRAGTARQV